jgi:uncharacterized glyoxalase superfamily protein PhnB
MSPDFLELCCPAALPQNDRVQSSTCPRLHLSFPRSHPGFRSATAQRRSSFTNQPLEPTKGIGLEGRGGVVARLAIRDSEFWVSDESPEHGNFSPETLNGSTVRMILTVADPDAVFAQACRAGARVVYAVSEGHGWRVGRVGFWAEFGDFATEFETLLYFPLSLPNFSRRTKTPIPCGTGVFCEGPGLKGAQFTLAARGTS